MLVAEFQMMDVGFRVMSEPVAVDTSVKFAGFNTLPGSVGSAPLAPSHIASSKLTEMDPRGNVTNAPLGTELAVTCGGAAGAI